MISRCWKASCIPLGVNPAAYSFNFTVVPIDQHPIGYLSVWPAGQAQPVVSTLNDQTGTIVANAAIVPANARCSGAITAYATDDTQLLIDINGYFAPPGTGGWQACRSTRRRLAGRSIRARSARDNRSTGKLAPSPGCGRRAVRSSEHRRRHSCSTRRWCQSERLGYLTLWPDGEDQPLVSTLNAPDGALTNNMAIVPTNNGTIDAYANGLTQLLLDISSYFAP